MKKILALVLVLMLAFSVAAMAETATETVKIGVFEPASGDSGAGGKQEILGMQYANYIQPTVEIGGTTYNVELVYADNQSSTDKAPSAAQQLVSEGVSVVLGSYGSGVSIAGAPIFEDAGIPAIGVTCTNPAVTEGNTHYFRICFLDPFQGTVLANYAYNELGRDHGLLPGRAWQRLRSGPGPLLPGGLPGAGRHGDRRELPHRHGGLHLLPVQRHHRRRAGVLRPLLSGLHLADRRSGGGAGRHLRAARL